MSSHVAHERCLPWRHARARLSSSSRWPCWPSAASQRAGSADGPKVTVFGDSVADKMQRNPVALAALNDGFTLDLQTRGCRRLVSPSCTIVGSSGTPTSVLPLVKYLGQRIGKIVVVDVGYNDTPTHYDHDLDAVMRALQKEHVKTVVWLTLRDPTPRLSGGERGHLRRAEGVARARDRRLGRVQRGPPGLVPARRPAPHPRRRSQPRAVHPRRARPARWLTTDADARSSSEAGAGLALIAAPGRPGPRRRGCRSGEAEGDADRRLRLRPDATQPGRARKPERRLPPQPPDPGVPEPRSAPVALSPASPGRRRPCSMSSRDSASTSARSSSSRTGTTTSRGAISTTSARSWARSATMVSRRSSGSRCATPGAPIGA